MIKIETHKGVNVLRDDLLPGGTKSVLMPHIISEDNEYVYATPVYGGFQIALAKYCQYAGKKATIFCARRKEHHANTKICIEAGANVHEVKGGYLSVVEKHARDYCTETGAIKLDFGACTDQNKQILSERVKKVIETLGHEPEEIFCAVGSGTLVESILMGTSTAMVYGVCVGKEYAMCHPRLIILNHHLPFDKECKMTPDFPSMANYDLKAWEYCLKYKSTNDVLFWNVL
jgi:hypothetical protein